MEGSAHPRLERAESFFELSLSLPCGTEALPVVGASRRRIGIHRGPEVGHGCLQPVEAIQPALRSRRGDRAQAGLERFDPGPRRDPDASAADWALGAEHARQQLVGEPPGLGDHATKPLVVRLDGNNVEEGRRILNDANHPLVTMVDTMDGAADRAAELASK